MSTNPFCTDKTKKDTCPYVFEHTHAWAKRIFRGLKDIGVVIFDYEWDWGGPKCFDVAKMTEAHLGHGKYFMVILEPGQIAVDKHDYSKPTTTRQRCDLCKTVGLTRTYKNCTGHGKEIFL